jgi:hypothetical protein
MARQEVGPGTKSRGLVDERPRPEHIALVEVDDVGVGKAARVEGGASHGRRALKRCTHATRN